MSKRSMIPSLKIAGLAMLLLGASTQALAQSPRDSYGNHRRSAEKAGDKEAATDKPAVAQKAPENKFPNATRTEPETKASAKLAPKLQKISDAYEKNETDKIVPMADEVIGDPKANPYERAIAARIAAASLIGTDDEKAKTYLLKAIEFNGLNNNDHYDSMYILAQLQMQDEKYPDSLATLDKLIAETKTTSPDIMGVRGNVLYRMERYPEAIVALKLAVAGTPDPKPEWLQLLMGAYFDSNQPQEAAKLAESMLAKNPNDKKTQLNLATIYMQADQNDKAAALMEKLRASGQLTDEKEYHNLYVLYLNMDGKEAQAISVIKEGLEKGILKSDYQTNVALGQAYYFSNQPGPAIEAYKKAAPLAPDGETYLNLAKVLWSESRIPEAKSAAQQALDKGIKKPEEAKKVLALKSK